MNHLKNSGEQDENEVNTTPLTSIFKIISRETDGNCLFHILYNIVFVGLLTAEYIREEICDFIFKKKQIYENLWESSLDNHIINMRKDGYWGTNLELLTFSDFRD